MMSQIRMAPMENLRTLVILKMVIDKGEKKGPRKSNKLLSEAHKLSKVMIPWISLFKTLKADKQEFGVISRTFVLYGIRLFPILIIKRCAVGRYIRLRWKLVQVPAFEP